MFESDDKLAEACNRLGATTREALEWVREATNNAVIGNATSLEKKLRKSVVTATKLEHAARRKMCVGVFGASQAGKSYLISALARKGQNRLMARFGDQLVDYIEYVNPEGGKESTGLVTRFSLDRPAAIPAGHPVQLGLLSEIDVVKVLANSYAFDVLHQATDVDGDDAEQEKRLFEVLDTIRASTSASANAYSIRVEEVYDLEDYCNTRLAGNDRIKLLRNAKFWDEAAELLPTVSVDARVTLYSLLWEELPVFTQLCGRLVKVLGLLGHAREVWCEHESLVTSDENGWARRPLSIINVSTLNGIGEESGRTVSVVAGAGTPVHIERAELTALVAELRIVMEEQPFEFFSHTDLLDFPGARTRKQVPKSNEILDSVDTRTENFLRGKVAYLFERYCDEQELSSMLLCVGPSNQEVATLPGMVEDWISVTHGPTPEERDKVETALFFVMTMFDKTFEQGAGSGVDGTRWTTRIEASLLSPFRKPHGTRWVSQWSSRGKFDNVFWVRNPNYRQDALFDYEDADSYVEVRVRDDKRGFIDTLKQAYLGNEEVRSYVADAEGAFDAGMQLNDGGFSRLAEHLAPICRPELKRKQVAERMRSLVGEISRLLSPHHISGDADTLRREKTELAKKVLQMFANCFKRQRLGEFQNSMRLDENQAYLVFQGSERAAAQILGGKQAGQPNEAVPIVTYASSGGDDLLSDLGLDSEPGVDGNDDLNGDNAPATPRQQDLAEKFVSDLEKAWSDTVGAMAGDKPAMDYLGLDGDVLVRLSQELLIGARRTGVFDTMVEAVRVAQQFKASSREIRIWRQVSPASAYFNDYLAWLGYRGDDPMGAQVQRLDDQAAFIFAPRPEVDGEVMLDEQVKPYEVAYFRDWLQALQATIRGNAEYQAGFSGNLEENARLGRILDALEGSSGG